jgi:serine/threonine-protein kinase Chk2
VLPNWAGFSAHHFCITFDANNNLIVKDLGSLLGTQVTYDDRGAGMRSDFKWIISGHDVPEMSRSIVIEIHKNFRFRIHPDQMNLSLGTQEYHQRVEKFRRGDRSFSSGELLGALRLQSQPATERPSGAHTPDTGDLWIPTRLGSGSFGIVHHFWNVSTGQEYVLKRPREFPVHKKNAIRAEWKQEAALMKAMTHVSSFPLAIILSPANARHSLTSSSS